MNGAPLCRSAWSISTTVSGRRGAGTTHSGGARAASAPHRSSSIVSVGVDARLCVKYSSSVYRENLRADPS